MNEECDCLTCVGMRLAEAFELGDSSAWDNIVVSLCPICGNKRCPKASNHEFECTGSDELGQEGSVYR